MSVRRLVFWITLLAVFAMATRISVDTDTWWHLRAGQWILENRQVPQVDPFSYTRGGQSWQYPGWLVEVPLYGIYWAFGPGGLNLWTAGMVTLAFYFIWRTLMGGEFLRAFVIVLAATASGVYWAARPYMVTFVLSAMFLWILEDFRTARQNRLWWLPLLMILWANSHGGFIIGFILFGVYGLNAIVEAVDLAPENRITVERAMLKRTNVDRLIFIGIGMIAAVTLNPSGPVMLVYPFKTVAIEALRDFIQEWQSPDFHSRQVQPFLWLLFSTLSAIGFSGRRMKLTDFILVTGFAYMSFLAARNIALFALVAPMVLTRHADPALASISKVLRFTTRAPAHAGPTRFQSRVNLVLLTALVVVVIAKASLVFPSAANEAYFEESLPVGAITYLKNETPPGRLFNHYNWGGYLVWALPEYPVFIDGRTDLYDDEIIQAWLQVVRAEAGWETILDDWGVTLALISPEMPLAGALDSAGWKELYAGEVEVLYGHLDRRQGNRGPD